MTVSRPACTSVEVQHAADTVQIRDGKDPGGPVLTFTVDEWDAFAEGVRAGDFDFLEPQGEPMPGLDVHLHIHLPGLVDHTAQLTRMENLMATEAEQITALGAKFDDLVGDVRAALATLAADRDSLGPDGQAALDALTARVDAFDAEVGDADGSDTGGVPVA